MRLEVQVCPAGTATLSPWQRMERWDSGVEPEPINRLTHTHKNTPQHALAPPVLTGNSPELN